jgi:hypothetical protein
MASTAQSPHCPLLHTSQQHAATAAAARVARAHFKDGARLADGGDLQGKDWSERSRFAAAGGWDWAADGASH